MQSRKLSHTRNTQTRFNTWTSAALSCQASQIKPSGEQAIMCPGSYHLALQTGPKTLLSPTSGSFDSVAMLPLSRYCRGPRSSVVGWLAPSGRQLVGQIDSLEMSRQTALSGPDAEPLNGRRMVPFSRPFARLGSKRAVTPETALDHRSSDCRCKVGLLE